MNDRMQAPFVTTEGFFVFLQNDSLQTESGFHRNIKMSPEVTFQSVDKVAFQKRIATFLMNHSKNEDKFVNCILVSQTFGCN